MIDGLHATINDWANVAAVRSELHVILEELKKSLLPGVFSTNRRLIGQ
jgi:hypothetical protein